jgi:hypothetical protein
MEAAKNQTADPHTDIKPRKGKLLKIRSKLNETLKRGLLDKKPESK